MLKRLVFKKPLFLFFCIGEKVINLQMIKNEFWKNVFFYVFERQRAGLRERGNEGKVREIERKSLPFTPLLPTCL